MELPRPLLNLIKASFTIKDQWPSGKALEDECKGFFFLIHMHKKSEKIQRSLKLKDFQFVHYNKEIAKVYKSFKRS